jgi:hypothetical protein
MCVCAQRRGEGERGKRRGRQTERRRVERKRESKEFSYTVEVW